MPLRHCSKCNHEWEGSRKICNWCGSDSYILEEKTPMEEAMGELRVICSLGDETITWDPDSDKASDSAEKRFNELIKQGFRAFRIDETGKKEGQPIIRFPVHAGRVLMIPVGKVVGG